MIYIFAISFVSLALCMVYLNLPFWSFLIALSTLPIIYMANKKGSNNVSSSISANQLFLSILIPIILLKWNDVSKAEVYIIIFILSSYLKFIFLFFRHIIILFSSWIPISYLIFDLINIKFNNVIYGTIGASFVFLIAIRDCMMNRRKKSEDEILRR